MTRQKKEGKKEKKCGLFFTLLFFEANGKPREKIGKILLHSMCRHPPVSSTGTSQPIYVRETKKTSISEN